MLREEERCFQRKNDASWRRMMLPEEELSFLEKNDASCVRMMLPEGQCDELVQAQCDAQDVQSFGSHSPLVKQHQSQGLHAKGRPP